MAGPLAPETLTTLVRRVGPGGPLGPALVEAPPGAPFLATLDTADAATTEAAAARDRPAMQLRFFPGPYTPTDDPPAAGSRVEQDGVVYELLRDAVTHRDSTGTPKITMAPILPVADLYPFEAEIEGHDLNVDLYRPDDETTGPEGRRSSFVGSAPLEELNYLDVENAVVVTGGASFRVLDARAVGGRVTFSASKAGIR